jgi:hypothetical protein
MSHYGLLAVIIKDDLTLYLVYAIMYVNLLDFKLFIGSSKMNTHEHAPYRVFGYNDMCEDFDYPCKSFVEAVTIYRMLDKQGMNIVFISGVSLPVMERLEWGYLYPLTN